MLVYAGSGAFAVSEGERGEGRDTHAHQAREARLTNRSRAPQVQPAVSPQSVPCTSGAARSEPRVVGTWSYTCGHVVLHM